MDRQPMDIPKVPDYAKVPQTDFVEELIKLREEARAITIDGPSGTHFKRVLDRLLAILIDKL
jgi:hypothetical protein